MNKTILNLRNKLTKNYEKTGHGWLKLKEGNV